MSIDSRLRRGLERSANGATDDLVDNLPDALVRGRRRRRVIVAAKTTAIVAGLAIVAMEGPRLVGAIRTDQPAATPSPSVTATDFSAIAGTYTFELSDAAATVAANHMAGTWTIQLKPDGAIELSVPAGFTREGQAPAGNAFTLAASQLRTNLFFSDFCHSVGVYRWSLRGTRLTFTPLSEDCPVRQAIFASQPWNVRG
jgi:hypothetical protein